MPQQMHLGIEPGQPRLAAGGPAPELGSGKELLPMLEEAEAAARPMWRHPAFVVSSILTLLALITAGVLTLISVMGSGKNQVTSAAIQVSSGNAHLTWESSAPVELFVVTNDAPMDLTQLVTGDREAWIPSALDLYTPSSCFVIRPAGDEGRAVTLDSDTLTEQQAASICVRDSSNG